MITEWVESGVLYDPSLGRYIEADPIGLEGSSVANMNIYGYANQNALRYVDPTGRQTAAMCVGGPIPCTVGIGTNIIGGLGMAVILVMSGDTPSDDARDEAQGGSQQCAVNDNDPGDDDPCPEWYSELKIEFLGQTLTNSTDVEKANYNSAAKKYNSNCVPQGHPPLPLFEF